MPPAMSAMEGGPTPERPSQWALFTKGDVHELSQHMDKG